MSKIIEKKIKYFEVVDLKNKLGTLQIWQASVGILVLVVLGTCIASSICSKETKKDDASIK